MTEAEKKDRPRPAAPANIMSAKYKTIYDQNRDPFYGLEYDPYQDKVHDAR